MAYAPAFNDVWFNATSSGSGDFVVASAVSGYRTPATAAIPNGTTVHYSARTATEYENGEGVYTSGTVTLARTTIFASSNSNAKVTFGSVPTVAICPLAEDTITGIVVPGTSAIVLGGSATSSKLTLRSTTAAGTTDSIVFETGSQVEALRIDNAQRSIIGGTASLAVGGNDNQQQQWGTTDPTGGFTLGMFNATAGISAHIDFYRNKAASIGTGTVVASGDRLGEINFFGAQQTGTFATQNNAASIVCEVDAAVTSGAGADMPGRLLFLTTPDASGTPAEALRIDSSGFVTVGGFANVQVGAQSANMQIVGPSSEWSFSGITVGATTGTLGYAAAKTRGSTPSTQTIVVNGDQILEVSGWGSDGVAYQNAVAIRGYVDGGPGANDMPGRISCWTTPDGSATIAEAVRIDSSKRLVVGGGAAQNSAAISAHGTDVNTASMRVSSWSGSGPNFQAYRSNGGPVGTHTACGSGNVLMDLIGNGSDGTNFQQGGQITVECDGTVSAGVMPGRIRFLVSPAGGSTPAEAFRITAGKDCFSSGQLGYGPAGAGVGGAVTQATNRTTGVTLNTICGAITLVSAAGSTSFNQFTVTNSKVATTDAVIVSQKSGTDKYRIYVTNVAAGSFQINFATISGTTTEQPVFNFAIIKGQTT
jgi:hypothetical protein